MSAATFCPYRSLELVLPRNGKAHPVPAKGQAYGHAGAQLGNDARDHGFPCKSGGLTQ